MKKNKKLFWFTLVELVLVIAIIWILAIWVSQISFTSLSDKENLEKFTNKIISNFEEVRNYSLIWKWIWTNLDNPIKWKIEISNSWSWNISSYYLTWATWEKYNENIFWNYYEIKEIKCSNLDYTSSWTIAWTWIIEISWSQLTLTWACNDILVSNPKKIITKISYKNNFENTLEINTVNWLINLVK